MEATAVNIIIQKAESHLKRHCDFSYRHAYPGSLNISDGEERPCHHSHFSKGNPKPATTGIKFADSWALVQTYGFRISGDRAQESAFFEAGDSETPKG